MNSGTPIKGIVTIKTFDSATGESSEMVVENMVVNLGLLYFAGRVFNPAQEVRAIAYMGVGASTQPVDPSDNGLVSSQAMAETYAPSLSGASISVLASFDEGIATGNITEMGLFLSDRTLVARTVIPAQTKTTTTSMSVLWSLTFQAA